jgi:cholesterol transport system auxiliary component
MRWREALFGAAVTVMAVALAGCALGPQMREQPVSYDLGPPRSHAGSNPGIQATLLLPEVSAPAWLDGQGIVYRLSYENAARPQAYAQSRWAAPPAALLTQRLRGRFAAAAVSGIVTGSDGARADYALRIELEDFSQSFHAPNASRVAVRAREPGEPRQPHTRRPARFLGGAGGTHPRRARGGRGALRGERRPGRKIARVDGRADPGPAPQVERITAQCEARQGRKGKSGI